MVLVSTYDPAANRLDPIYESDQAKERHVNLAQGTYVAGQVLGELASPAGTYDHLVDTVLAAPTGAPTLTTPTGGSLASGDYTVGYTWVDSNGVESALSPLATTTAAANDVVHVAAVTKPTNVVGVNWYMSRGAGDPNLALVLNNNGAAADFATAPTSGAPDAPSSADGGGVAKAILRYACTVDADGDIALADEVASTSPSTPAFYRGVFRSEDVTGLTAKALRDLAGALIDGDLTTGIFRIG